MNPSNILVGKDIPVAYPYQYFESSLIVWLIVSIALFLIVVVTAVYFLFKYRYVKGKNEEGEHIEGNTVLEIIWIVIPTILVIIIGSYSVGAFMKQRTSPPDALEINVVAFMWGWEFNYPNGKVVIANNIENYNPPEEQKAYIPLGKPIKVYLTSRDVIHSFYVVDARVTEDCVPGRITYLWFQFNKPGEYYVLCKEFCGTWHSRMYAVLKVVPEDEFNKWLNQKY